MATKILLTTLSTLNNKDYSYYIDRESSKYTIGISQQECGAKYILSKMAIDSMVILGSEQVYDKDDLLNIPQFSDVYDMPDFFDDKTRSDYEFFIYRLAQFVKSDNLDIESDKLCKKIEENRKAAIRKIVDDCKNEIVSEKFSNISAILSDDTQQVELIKKIRESIENDIKQNFIDESDYDNYTSPVSKYPEVVRIKEDSNYLQIKDNIEKIENAIDKIKNDKKSSLLNIESLCVSYSKVLQNQMLELMMYKQKKLHEESKVYKEIINRLRDANNKLIGEINVYKTNRIKLELDYAKYYLYTLIPKDNIITSLPENSNISIEFKPLYKEDGSDNIENIIETILGHVDSGSNNVELYIDIQGGNRTDGYVRNALLSILQNEKDSKISIEKIIATNFNRKYYASEIVDETGRYLINDLVSGMNAFIRYGKVDAIKLYIKNNGLDQNDYVKDLVTYMKKIDDALNICDVVGLEKSLVDIEKYLADDNNVKNLPAQFSILINGIKKDYSGIVKEDVADTVQLIKWAINKGFIQQALTLYVEKMPLYYLNHGVFDNVLDIMMAGWSCADDNCSIDEKRSIVIFKDKSKNISDEPENVAKRFYGYFYLFFSTDENVVQFYRALDNSSVKDKSDSGSIIAVLDSEIDNKYNSELNYLKAKLQNMDTDEKVNKYIANCVKKGKSELDEVFTKNNYDICGISAKNYYIRYPKPSKSSYRDDDAIKQRKTVKKKADCLKNLTNSYVNTNKYDKGKLKTILVFYLAAKMLRNQTNHASESQYIQEELDTCRYIKNIIKRYSINFEAAYKNKNISEIKKTLLEGLNYLDINP